eukprot:CAMPEP_0180691098 /NCGR_PEP_ID=MMETSP1038_2-20121128/32_1 /TAXON_ID=632150 /ORGANISM="Azadinium spinosum, Strain 3D9" /LENGTH=97 /DNA_ID=CAMNT_0022722023 /DNA_START=266 /DNA_END=555 /DNA_ORIENTATION=+
MLPPQSPWATGELLLSTSRKSAPVQRCTTTQKEGVREAEPNELQMRQIFPAGPASPTESRLSFSDASVAPTAADADAEVDDDAKPDCFDCGCCGSGS